MAMSGVTPSTDYGVCCNNYCGDEGNDEINDQIKIGAGICCPAYVVMALVVMALVVMARMTHKNLKQLSIEDWHIAIHGLQYMDKASRQSR